MGPHRSHFTATDANIHLSGKVEVCTAAAPVRCGQEHELRQTEDLRLSDSLTNLYLMWEQPSKIKIIAKGR